MSQKTFQDALKTLISNTQAS